MKFYFQADENLCADERWVAEKLHMDYPEFSVEDHLENLRTRRQWFGWYECEVCDTIEDALR